MHKVHAVVWCGIAAVVVLLCTASSVEAQRGPRRLVRRAERPDRPRNRYVEGTITAVAPVTITRANGTSVILTVTTTTVIRLDGAASTVGSLLVGMRAEARYLVTSTANNAIRINASDKFRVEGTITAVAPVTITPANGTSVTLTVTSATVIRLDGAASVVGSLAVGMEAEATYQLTSTANNAIRIAASDKLRVEGTITAVAATATPPTVTITRANGTSIMLTVTTTTVIRINGKKSTVDKLVLNMRAEATYLLTSTANNAISIAAGRDGDHEHEHEHE